MNPNTATAVHAYLMIIIGLYKFSDTSAPIDILMSVIFAVPLLTLNSGVEYGNKPSLNISTLLSLSSIIVFSISGYKAFLNMDSLGMFINGILVLTGIYSFALLIRHFINEGNRKARRRKNLTLNKTIMKAHEASAVHALLLVGLGLWGYFDTGANTAFIPVVMGALLILMVPGVKKENKIIAHIAVLVTLLAVLGVTKPLMAQIDKGDTMGMIRTGLMLLSGLYAMFTFVQSFRAARKSKRIS